MPFAADSLSVTEKRLEKKTTYKWQQSEREHITIILAAAMPDFNS